MKTPISEGSGGDFFPPHNFPTIVYLYRHPTMRFFFQFSKSNLFCVGIFLDHIILCASREDIKLVNIFELRNFHASRGYNEEGALIQRPNIFFVG